MRFQFTKSAVEKMQEHGINQAEFETYIIEDIKKGMVSADLSSIDKLAMHMVQKPENVWWFTKYKNRGIYVDSAKMQPVVMPSEGDFTSESIDGLLTPMIHVPDTEED